MRLFLDYIQRAHLNYMWEGAEPNSGLAPERNHIDVPSDDAHIITTGGSGFGIAGLLVGVERGFIPRAEAVERFTKIVTFLEKSDRYHGVWSHWIDGRTGKTKPFGQKDNGGDLVESAFLMQGLLCVRQYFKDGNDAEKALAQRIDNLWREMEWRARLFLRILHQQPIRAGVVLHINRHRLGGHHHLSADDCDQRLVGQTHGHLFGLV